MRRRRRKAFWKSVQAAAGNEDGSMYARKINPIWGMRAIRDFEKINGIEFDPGNSLHRMITFHMGRQLLGLRLMQKMLPK